MNDSQQELDDEEKLHLAELNRYSAEKAMTMSAFKAASVFVAQGIALLEGESTWKNHYQLALDLYSTGVESENSIGNSERMESYVQEVMSNGTRSPRDTLRAYITWADSLANRGAMADAAADTLAYLRRFGIRFAKSSGATNLRILANIVKLKQGLKGDLLQRISKLPMENDATRI